jgi:hypothetical protein
MNIREAHMPAAEGIRQAGVVEPEQVQDRGVEIMHVDRGILSNGSV